MPRRIFYLFPLLMICYALSGSARAQIVPVIADFGKPFLFAYGTWEKVARLENGALILDAPNAQGGLGTNLQPAINLSADTQMSPVFRVVIGPKNQLKRLRLMLRDEAGGNAAWNFSLEGKPVGQTVILTPDEGASVAQPNEIGKEGAPDFSQIFQWQIIGDWSAGPVDLKIESVSLQSPSPEILAARAQGEKRRADAAEQLKQTRKALLEKYRAGAPLAPVVQNLAPVAPDVLALQIHAGQVILGHLEKYVKREDDSTREKKLDDGRVESLILVRDGQDIGWLIGPNRDWLTTKSSYQGDPLLDFVADNPANYSLQSNDDANFQTPVAPLEVSRKSTPTQWAEGSDNFEMDHTIYLRWPKPLTPGKNYQLNLGALNTRVSSVKLNFDPAHVRSEAVHVNQIGYRPTDPVKRAFVSCWMGTGGALKLPAQMKFSVVDDATGKAVFSGQSSDLWPTDKIELQQTDRNFSGTDVMRLDFSKLQTPGRYRVVVAGVGASYPFNIGEATWKNALLVQMKGLYNNRSGIEVGPPYSDFKKPRDMFVGDDGVRVTWTKYRAVEGGGENFKAIAQGDTGQAAPGWGGYHDAGDWNPRRVTHMKVTLAQLELLDLFPNFYAPLKLNIPPSQVAAPGTPDILNEAIFEFETFHRLQRENGGVGYGLETQGDPAPGEVSWLQSFPIYALAPDYAASWFYAAVGARLSYLLQPYDAKLAQTYRESAINAFAFAEKDWANDQQTIKDTKRDAWGDIDTRNMAALELYRLTKDKRYHDLFLQDTVLTEEKPELFQWGKHVQRDAAFVYARLPAELGDAELKRKAAAGLETMANRALEYASNNAFNLTTPDKGKPQFIGFYSSPDATDLTRAHFLTKDEKYLAGAVAATQFQSGANPNNLVYTTGLGANPVKHPLFLDAARTGQSAPVGLTPYGNVDLVNWHEQWITWPITWFLSRNTVPDPYSWPTNEAYWDIGGWPALDEFTVDAWAPNVAVWGYLAARAK